MNKETIKNRISELQKELEKISANGNVIVGAIHDCNYWLAELEKDSDEMPICSGQ